MLESWRDVRIFGQRHRRRRHFDARKILLSTLDNVCLVFYTAFSKCSPKLLLFTDDVNIDNRTIEKGHFCNRFFSRSIPTSIGDLSSKRVKRAARVSKRATPETKMPSPLFTTYIALDFNKQTKTSVR